MECAAVAALSNLQTTGRPWIGPVLDSVRDPKRGNSPALHSTSPSPRAKSNCYPRSGIVVPKLVLPSGLGYLVGCCLRHQGILTVNPTSSWGAAGRTWVTLCLITLLRWSALRTVERSGECVSTHRGAEPSAGRAATSATVGGFFCPAPTTRRSRIRYG